MVANVKRDKLFKIYDQSLTVILAFGIFFLLCGLTLLPNRSDYHQVFYLTVALPSLLLIISRIRKAEQTHNPIIYLFLLLSVWSFISLILNSAPENLTTVAKRTLYIYLTFIGFIITLERLNKKSLHIILLSGATVLLASLYGLFSPSALKHNIRFIGTGALDNSLLSSHLFGFFTVIFALTAINSKKTTWRFVYSAAAISMLFITLSTGSRTPIIALVATALWLPLMHNNKKAAIPILLLALSILATYFHSPELLLNRGLSYRPELLELALNEAMQSPIFGHGFDAKLSLYIEAYNSAF